MQNLSIVGTYRTCAPEGIRYLKAASVQVWLVNHSDTTAWWVSRWIVHWYFSLRLGGFWGWNKTDGWLIRYLLGCKAGRWRGIENLRGVAGRWTPQVGTYLLTYLPAIKRLLFFFSFCIYEETTSHKRDLLPVFFCSLLTVTYCCLLLVVVGVAQGQCSVA